MVTSLLEKLSDPDKNVRDTAALVVGTQLETTCAEVLTEAWWAEPDLFVRETMTWAVTRLKEATMPAVLAAIKSDRSPETRVRALHVASKFANPETVDDILPYVTDPDEAVARKVRWALSRIQDPRAVPHLVALLGDHGPEERNALTNDLAAFGSAAVPTLAKALESGDGAVRRHAADVLCYIGHPDAEKAAAALGTAVEDSERPVAVAALMALGELRSDAARKHVQAAGESRDAHIRSIAERLVARKPRRATVQRKRPTG